MAEQSLGRRGREFVEAAGELDDDEHARVESLLILLLTVQWAGLVLLSLTASGSAGLVILLAGLVNAAPIALSRTKFGRRQRGYLIVAAQSLNAGLLIQVLGGSALAVGVVPAALALAALYRSVPVLVVAALVAVVDALFRLGFAPATLLGSSELSASVALVHFGVILLPALGLAVQIRMSRAALERSAQRQKSLDDSRAVLEARIADAEARGRRQAHRERRFKELLATVGHDLRNSLEGVIGHASLAETACPRDAGAVRLAAQAAQRSARGSLAIANDVFDHARWIGRGIEPCPEECDAVELLDAALLTAEGLAVGRTLELRRDYDDELGTLLTDPVMLRRILENLLANAIRATREGKVWLRARRRGGQLEVEVCDEGNGLSSQDRARFFHDAAPEASAVSRRRGLGLGIVRRFAERLDLRCVVEARSQRGTRVRLHVPAGRAPVRIGPRAETTIKAKSA